MTGQEVSYAQESALWKAVGECEAIANDTSDKVDELESKIEHVELLFHGRQRFPMFKVFFGASLGITLGIVLGIATADVLRTKTKEPDPPYTIQFDLEQYQRSYRPRDEFDT